MNWLDSLATTIPETAIALRLLVAACLGGVIGLDRELRDMPAGLRTHMLTSLAAAVFAVIALEMFEHIRRDGGAQGDPIRIVEAVTAGVAFLAAGAIIRDRGTVLGLTTGAGMWLAGAIGAACGAGYFVLAALAAALAFVILNLLKRLERSLSDEEDRTHAGRTPRA
ncbi:MAG TPA: MgtC/SapB family protein [Hyphomicrobiaceae bacterium]|nr:MgtC/SapB family protein [Hyphomicrobiaceae bacterium]